MSVAERAVDTGMPVSTPERYDYARFSMLTGPVQPAPAGRYRVGFRSVLAEDPRRLRMWLLMLAAPLAETGLLVWLVLPGHWHQRPFDPRTWLIVLDKIVLGTVILIELMRLAQTCSLVHGTLFARNPIPVEPDPKLRIAFLTTCVPGKEPPDLVRATLTAARAMRHPVPYDVWLLDEGDSAEMRELCAELGVRHFSRNGIRRWNTRTGMFRAKTKHGNYNAWLDLHGPDYDLMAMVDTDHVPRDNFLERTVGYFRDPDVAFVLGPQVYGNYTGTVTKAAESQQFLFHALVQRAGNRFGAPMLVGTNNVIRLSALYQARGFFDSITEDLLTGIKIHGNRNPATGRRWASVYTPDVLAVGEGPSSWSDFFGQQIRWSRGAYGFLGRHSWGLLWRLSPGRLYNYLTLLPFYPLTALSFILGVLSSVLYFGLGASGISVATANWMMFYSDAVVLQIALYSLIRKHNVSPHEPAGSTGIRGIAMGAMSSPVYAVSLVSALLWLPARFKVTPKGDSASPDRLWTFRINLCWALVLGGALVASGYTGFTYPAMEAWTAFALTTSLAPIVIWLIDSLRRRA